MIEFIFGFLIVCMLAERLLNERAHREERDSLMRAIMAKNLPEFEANATIKTPPVQKIPDEVPLEQADDDLFKKHLETIINNERPSENGADAI